MPALFLLVKLGVYLEVVLQVCDQILIGQPFLVLEDDVAGVVVAIETGDIDLIGLSRVVHALLYIDLVLDACFLYHERLKFLN